MGPDPVVPLHPRPPRRLPRRVRLPHDLSCQRGPLLHQRRLHRARPRRRRVHAGPPRRVRLWVRVRRRRVHGPGRRARRHPPRRRLRRVHRRLCRRPHV
ncbi:hypothetical protein BU14_0074s0060 [Porphyra umbilicalis]|uniref:Uncharacterized protein n=1 Tax=Porphyra umbilicalis TaxID=2786 RepID=A0A1X6PFM0_PORUM|nr:hypothetical protein BU14_0074s0060 [Porphyra umbilicalis]|eukprot:OSX79630.1 hypothetical protein BU14_0074s0060 [Porphyra umbilicalis]